MASPRGFPSLLPSVPKKKSCELLLAHTRRSRGEEGERSSRINSFALFFFSEILEERRRKGRRSAATVRTPPAVNFNSQLGFSLLLPPLFRKTRLQRSDEEKKEEGRTVQAPLTPKRLLKHSERKLSSSSRVGKKKRRREHHSSLPLLLLLFLQYNELSKRRLLSSLPLPFFFFSRKIP